ncbi:MAG: 50S ribosomal protein L1 [Actinomycetota bacterium]|jgi:large subunit ribosomal protein L1|nr:50S ribosomal protein L1 [Actinomycetota bacterium]
MATSKNVAEVERNHNSEALHTPEEAMALVKSLSYAKFDESVDIVFNLGIDSRHAEQIVRGTVSLPHGTGKDIKVAVFANDQAKAAEEAGADLVGGQDLADRITSGDVPLDWDVTIATPDMMSVVGKLGQLLGPRGLMPNPKSGTVTNDVAKTVGEFKSGRVEYRNDRYGNVHIPTGRVSFDGDKLVDNFVAIADEIARSRPASTKGIFIKKISVSSTMGPGIKIDTSAVTDLIKSRR